jgi:chorismate mutase / prephenate dehydratase
MTERVHFLGPEGTFAHSAALKHYGNAQIESGSVELTPESDILSVFDAVRADPNAQGVVPIENSIEGSVSMTLEALLESPELKIIGEVTVDVEQCLLGQGPLSAIRTVYSHPHGLAQCKHWLRANLPHANRTALGSTSAGAYLIRSEPHAAAIASELAAKLAGVPVLERAIQDGKENATRFLVLGRVEPQPTGNDQTSIVFGAPHKQGALYHILGIFAQEGINLSRIESRPKPGRMWQYIFYADLEGHASEPRLLKALERLDEEVPMHRVLGSYPRG